MAKSLAWPFSLAADRFRSRATRAGSGTRQILRSCCAPLMLICCSSVAGAQLIASPFVKPFTLTYHHTSKDVRSHELLSFDLSELKRSYAQNVLAGRMSQESAESAVQDAADESGIAYDLHDVTISSDARDVLVATGTAVFPSQPAESTVVVRGDGSSFDAAGPDGVLLCWERASTDVVSNYPYLGDEFAGPLAGIARQLANGVVDHVGHPGVGARQLKSYRTRWSGELPPRLSEVDELFGSLLKCRWRFDRYVRLGDIWVPQAITQFVNEFTTRTGKSTAEPSTVQTYELVYGAPSSIDSKWFQVDTYFRRGRVVQYEDRFGAVESFPITNQSMPLIDQRNDRRVQLAVWRKSARSGNVVATQLLIAFFVGCGLLFSLKPAAFSRKGRDQSRA